MRFLTDDEMKRLEASPQYSRFEGRCPTCDGTGSYVYDGDIHECEQDGAMCKQHRLFRLYCLANIPMQYMSLDWETFPHEHAKKAVDTYLDKYDGMRRMGIGVEIFGKRLGTGKTFTLCHILKHVAKLGHSVRFTTFTDIKDMIHLTHSEWTEAAKPLLEVEFLGIDEILRPVSEAQRHFFEEKLEWIVRQRSNFNLPTGTTTNLTEEEMKEEYPRVYSVLSLKQVRIELDGIDFRNTKNFMSLAEIAMSGERPPIS